MCLRTTKNKLTTKKVLTNTNISGTFVCKALLASIFCTWTNTAFRASEFSFAVICFPTKPKTQAESDFGASRNSCFYSPVIIRWLESNRVCYWGWVECLEQVANAFFPAMKQNRALRNLISLSFNHRNWNVSSESNKNVKSMLRLTIKTFIWNWKRYI